MAKAASIEKNRHRFYPCKCGVSHPSITTLLDVISSPALMGWAAKNGTTKLNILKGAIETIIPGQLPVIGKVAEDVWAVTETTDFWKSGRESAKDAADYGTLAHAWIESHLHGVDVTLDSLPDPTRQAVEAFLAWKKEHSLKVIKTEETFFNCKLNYAGTTDAVCELDGELTLLDWKTSSGIFSNYAVQVWAYALADESQNAERLYRQVAVGRFGKDGSTEVKIFKRNEFPGIEMAREVMIGCGHIFKFLQEWEKTFPYQRKPKTNGNGKDK